MQNPKVFWRRIFAGPFLSPIANSVASAAVTTPDFIEMNGEKNLYIGGVEAGKERIIRIRLGEADWTKPAPNLVASASVVLNAGPKDYDCFHVYDPAVIILDGMTYLFYSAIGKGPDSIGLAVSSNGKEFQKRDRPLIIGRSPEVVWHDGNFFLFYVLRSPSGGYQIHLSLSKDSVSFHDFSVEPVLQVGKAGSWDQFEVTTPRIFSRGGWYYMIYAGGQTSDRKDMPAAFGLARSMDLIHWEKYPHNPVFTTGVPGSWDDGALWFGTVFMWDDQLYLLYEGGRLIDIENQIPALTQVGLARLSCTDFDRAQAGC